MTRLLREHPARRELRPLIDDFAAALPFVGSIMSRLGAVRACRENALELLRRGEVIGVFPEGLRGIGKPYERRYRLERFGRGGFVHVAARSGAPIVPAASPSTTPRVKSVFPAPRSPESRSTAGPSSDAPTRRPSASVSSGDDV